MATQPTLSVPQGNAPIAAETHETGAPSQGQTPTATQPTLSIPQGNAPIGGETQQTGTAPQGTAPVGYDTGDPSTPTQGQAPTGVLGGIPQGNAPIAANTYGTGASPQGQDPTGDETGESEYPSGQYPTGDETGESEYPSGQYPSGDETGEREYPSGQDPTGDETGESEYPSTYPQGQDPTGQTGETGETDETGALPQGHAPIDETYYHCSGPASAFEQEFDPHICSYDDLFTHFQPTIEQANQPHGDGEQAANFIHVAIQTVCAEPDCEGVEDIVLLCMIMQESTGNCYVPTTTDADGQGTGGLLQCSGCTGVEAGGQLTQEIVTDMVHAGALHYKQCLDDQNGNVYEALRKYNSGSIASDGDLASTKSVGTPTYVTDIGNRFHGWISGGNT